MDEVETKLLIKTMKENKELTTAGEAREFIQSKARHEFILEIFELWIGREMMDQEYDDYLLRWNQEITYNLKTFIKEQGLKVKKGHKYKYKEFEEH